MTTTSTNRVIQIGTLKNIKHLGGCVGADGRRVRDGLLIRSEALNSLSDEEAAALSRHYGIQYVVDFRMEYERARQADKALPGAQNEWITVYEMDMTDPDNIAPMSRIRRLKNELEKIVEHAKTGRLATLYTDFLLGKKGRQGYARFFDLLLKAEGAVFWHCSYGKDRTGVAAALVLCALGADEDTILEDFELSNVSYQRNIHRLEELLKSSGYDDTLVGEAQAVAGVKGEYLKAAFDAIKKEYGSMEDYLRNQLGATDEKRDYLREKYLEKVQ